MNIVRRLGAATGLALAVAALGAAAHPSPKVVLVKHADFIRQTLTGATQYFVRTVDIGKQDLAAIRQKSDFTPEDPDVQFYLGQGAGGAPAGAVLFQQVDTPHGPLEVGLSFKPDGAIARAMVTTATVETKPWVQEAIGTGLMDRFTGLRQGDDPRKALAAIDGKLGGMPQYMAELIATAVGRGMVLYSTLYKGSST
jgi:hypothetical protein